VRAVLISIGVSLTLIALAAWQRGGMASRRRQPQPATPAPPSDAEDDWA
jgi:uncharacterized membrane protein YidH (DUF202 family)